METPWTIAYQQHFAQHFGKPFDVHQYRSADGIPLRLATYDLRYRQFRTYASLGLADEYDEAPAEVILLADDFSKDVPYLFVNSLYFIVDKNIPLAPGFAVGGVDLLRPDFADQNDKVALYYTKADGFDEGFDTVECTIEGEKEKGTILQAIFISAAELDFLKRQGPDEFDKKFRTQDTELCSVKRPSCV